MRLTEDRLLLVALAATLVLGAVRLLRLDWSVATSVDRTDVAATVPPPHTRDSVNILIAAALSRSPFRIADAPFAPGSAATSAPPVSGAVPLPDVRLKALVGGPPWLAVVSGDPSHPELDRVVRRGDSLGVVRVRAISAQGLTLGAGDSTWILLMPPGAGQ